MSCLGSTTLTADADGNLRSRTLYSAWGEVRYTSGASPTDYTYTGQYSNTADFGLMYYRARWYDPALGRFAQADTVVPGAGNPMAWDRYAYALNNSLRYSDPSGHVAARPMHDMDEKLPTRKWDRDWKRPSRKPDTTVPTSEIATPKNVNVPLPDLPTYATFMNPQPTITSMPTGYELVPTKIFILSEVDWFHLVTNTAGVISDVAVIASLFGVTAPATVPIAVIGRVINGVGIASDAYDVIQGDFSGISWTALSTVAEKTTARRFVPLVGLSINVQGAYDAWMAGWVDAYEYKKLPSYNNMPSTPPPSCPPQH